MTDLRVVGGDLLPPRDGTPPPALDRRPRPRRRRAPARDGALVRALAGARQQEAADPARPARPERLLRVVDAHELVVRARGEAPLGRHADAEGGRLVGRQGRVAEGHGADAVGLRPGRDRAPPPRGRRRAVRRACHRGARRERRRRQAPASDAGAARPLHDARGVRPARRPARRDRRRRRPLARRAVARPGAAARRRRRDPRRPAGAPADRASRRRRTTSARSPTPTSSTSCACSRSACSRARTSSRRCASTRRAGGSRPSGFAPGQRVMHPGPDEPRRRDRRARRRLRRGADRRPGALRADRAHGGALRPADDRPGRRRDGSGGRVMLVGRTGADDVVDPRRARPRPGRRESTRRSTSASTTA